MKAVNIFLAKGKTKYSSLAQSVEHAAVNRVVVGSSPTGGAIKKDIQSDVFFQLYLPSASYIASQLYSASPSDIVLRTVIGKYNITEAEGFNITFALQKYHSNFSWNITKNSASIM